MEGLTLAKRPEAKKRQYWIASIDPNDMPHGVRVRRGSRLDGAGDVGLETGRGPDLQKVISAVFSSKAFHVEAHPPSQPLHVVHGLTGWVRTPQTPDKASPSPAI